MGPRYVEPSRKKREDVDISLVLVGSMMLSLLFVLTAQLASQRLLVLVIFAVVFLFVIFGVGFFGVPGLY